MTSKRAVTFLSASLLCSVVALVPASARADVVVNGAQQPAPAPAPVVVQPQAPAPVVEAPPAPAPVVETPPARHTTVIEHEPHSYVGTVFVSALMGGLAGVLIGGSIYYLADNRTNSQRILYWGAGGVIVGAGVGVLQVASEESRLDRAAAMHLPTDPAPTYRLALYQVRF